MAANLPGSEAEFIDMGEGQIRASTMLGKEVFGQDEESIGEVADLVLQDDGQTRAAIIDVGGFLGVGEKRVAIPFNEIQTAQEGDNVKLTVAMSREQLEQAPEYVAPDTAAASTDTATAPATDLAAGTAGAPATDASRAPATDVAASGAATDPNAPATSGDAAGTEYELASQELTADNLIGSAVYSPNEDNLGEVNDVVFDQAGTIQGVVIDVGGFLGVGEKPVAVQYDALNVQKEDNGDLRIVVNATQEQLEGAPAFDDAPAQ
jgi:sporulation protein YlmC with PRC-barrel domain